MGSTCFKHFYQNDRGLTSRHCITWYFIFLPNFTNVNWMKKEDCILKLNRVCIRIGRGGSLCAWAKFYQKSFLPRMFKLIFLAEFSSDKLSISQLLRAVGAIQSPLACSCQEVVWLFIEVRKRKFDPSIKFQYRLSKGI